MSRPWVFHMLDVGVGIICHNRIYEERLRTYVKDNAQNVRAAQWQPQPVDTILAAQPVSILEHISILGSSQASHAAGTERRLISSPRVVRGGALEALPEAEKQRVFASFPTSHNRGSILIPELYLQGGGCGYVHRKERRKIATKTNKTRHNN